MSGIVFTVIRLDQCAEGFYESVSAVPRVVADLIHQFTKLCDCGVVFALVSRSNKQPQFLRAGDPTGDYSGFHLFHLSVSYSRWARISRI